MTDYSSSYSEGGFWSKLREIDGVGHLIELAIKLYNILKNPEVPAWVKSVCVAALGYLIFPVDAVPDLIPVLGLGDDAGVLTGAVAAIGSQWSRG